MQTHKGKDAEGTPAARPRSSVGLASHGLWSDPRCRRQPPSPLRHRRRQCFHPDPQQFRGIRVGGTLGLLPARDGSWRDGGRPAQSREWRRRHLFMLYPARTPRTDGAAAARPWKWRPTIGNSSSSLAVHGLSRVCVWGLCRKKGCVRQAAGGGGGYLCALIGVTSIATNF